MTSSAVLVVEDDRSMRKYLRGALEAHNYAVTEAGSLAEANTATAAQSFAAVLLDLGLPDGDGLTLVRAMRAAASTIPVIVISARQREDDKVDALDAGANDYLTKPFGTRELLARIRVALRHATQPASDDPVIRIGPFVLVNGDVVHLTPIEFGILALLARHAGKVITHGQLLSEIWGPRGKEQTHYLRVHVAALRRKVEQDPTRPRWLTTEQGVGYRLRDE